MKKSIIFTFVRYSENSMVASIKIARYLSEFLQLPVVDYQNIDKFVEKELDVLYIVNGAYGFCKCLPELAILVLGARRIVWVQNDYSIIPPKIDSQGHSPFRAAFRQRHEAGLPHMDFWSTCEEWASRKGSSYVNWNMLTFDPDMSLARIKAMRPLAYRNLFYYGSYRDGSGKSSRVPLFDRYFREPLVKTLISSPSDKFRERYEHRNVQHMGPILEDFYEFLGKQGIGLYIEDRKSSENFHSPANRFYEMLSAGLPMVFQPECGPMLRRAGFNPSRYVVEKARDVPKMLDSREVIGLEQREWAKGRDFQAELWKQVQDAHEKLMEVAA